MKRVIAGLFVLFLSGSVFGEMVVLEKWRVAERSSISVNVFKSSSDHIGFRLVLGALGNKSWRYICSNSWDDDLAEDLMPKIVDFLNDEDEINGRDLAKEIGLNCYSQEN